MSTTHPLPLQTSGTQTLSAATDALVGRATTDMLTNTLLLACGVSFVSVSVVARPTGCPSMS
jgi:hypothetical protein